MTAVQIDKELRNVFIKWEPRVKIEKIDITPYPDENMYVLKVIYSVPTLKVYGEIFESEISR